MTSPAKKGARARPGGLGDSDIAVDPARAERLIALDDALERLAALDARQAQIVEDRFRALAIQQRALEPEHYSTIYTRVLLAGILVDSGRAAAAEGLLREAVATGARRVPATQPNYAEARSVLGACLNMLGKTAEAEPFLASGYDALRTTLGDDHSMTREARARAASGRSAAFDRP